MCRLHQLIKIEMGKKLDLKNKFYIEAALEHTISLLAHVYIDFDTQSNC